MFWNPYPTFTHHNIIKDMSLKNTILLICATILGSVFLIARVSINQNPKAAIFNLNEGKSEYAQLRDRITAEYKNRPPKEWGSELRGIGSKLNTDKQVLALTFDADPGGYDQKMIDFLIREQVPATLFISGPWLNNHGKILRSLSQNSLFEIENHGLKHRPCSVDGRSIFGIKGSGNIGEVVDEIELNARHIESVTGSKPGYFRAGTGYYDDVCLDIARELGYRVAGFNVRGDAGAMLDKDHIKERLLGAPPGSIIVLHMNHPEKNIGQAVIEAIPELKEKGYGFVRLSDFGIK